MVMRRVVFGIAAGVFISRIAFSQTSEELDRARIQFQEALSLEVAGDFSLALTKLQLVAKVKLTPQVRYHLARCKEHLGRLTEALGDYRVAATEARENNLEDVGEFDRALAELETRVPRIKLHLDSVSTNARVELDGVALGSAVLGDTIPVDPGIRRVTLQEASFPSRTIEVNAIEGRVVEVQLQGNVLAPKPEPEPEPRRPPIKVESAPVWPYLAAGVGAVAVGTSIAFFVVRNHAISDLERECTNKVCPEELRSTWERGKFASWAAPTTLVIGLTSIGFSVWGFSSSSRRTIAERTSLQRRISVVSSSGYVGVRLSGGF
jgi:hypothetical protein